MKTPIIAAAVLFICIGSCGTSQAQSTSVNFLDYHYDYELYVADPDTTDWYIVWTLDDGSTLEEGPFQTQAGAQDRLVWYFLSGNERGPYAEIKELTKPPGWQYFGTFDTYAEAADMAEYFWSVGLLTDINSIFDSSRLMRRTQHLTGMSLTGARVSVNRRIP